MANRTSPNVNVGVNIGALGAVDSGIQVKPENIYNLELDSKHLTLDSKTISFSANAFNTPGNLYLFDINGGASGAESGNHYFYRIFYASNGPQRFDGN